MMPATLCRTTIGLALASVAALAGCSDSGSADTTSGSADSATSAPDSSATTEASVRLPPVNAGADYQIAGDYELVGDTAIVSRDWLEGDPAEGAYSICYVNAFQTQPDDPDIERPDETSAWPAALVLSALADDPNWTGEYLIDISTPDLRAAAAEWVAQMVSTCGDKGFDAVEFDNLDSWTRFADEPSVQALVTFGRDDAVAFATLITEQAHSLGMAVGQKNTIELIDDGGAEQIGFDFAVVEECGRYGECEGYAGAYEDRVMDIEYTDQGFGAACDALGDRISIVRRDHLVSQPDGPDYVLEQC